MKNQLEQYPKSYLYHRIVKAKLFIDANLQEAINLDKIADEALFSKFHFIRLFKSIYNKTPHQYLTRVRIDHAKLLLQNNKSVSETAHQVGFESITSFTALFKALEGKTPSHFQQYHLHRQESIRQHPLRFIPNCFAEQKGWIKNSNFQ